MKSAKLTALLALGTFAVGALAAGPAEAADHVVVQVDKQYSPTALTIKAGDRVTFRNADRIDHHVISYTPTMPFDLGLQLPGDENSVEFKTPGKVIVNCDLHGKMEVAITVE